MSTYTDLHNRLKENITIMHQPGRKDHGMTPQLVKFMNPENEYYGTFFGEMKNASGTLSGVSISGATIIGAKISDATVNGVDLDTIGEQIQILTGDFEDLEDKFYKLCCDDFGNLVDCQHKLISCVQSSCDAMYKMINACNAKDKIFANDISALQKNVKDLQDDKSLSIVSANIKNDINEKYKSNYSRIQEISSFLNNKIDDVSAELVDDFTNQIGETNDLFDLSCKTIISNLAKEVNDRCDNDISIAQDAKDYADEQTKINKHYSFNTINAQNLYKFQVEDYAINTIEMQPDCAKIINPEGTTVVGAVKNIISNTGLNTMVQYIMIRFFDSATEIPQNLRNVNIKLERNIPYANGLEWIPDNSYHYDDPTAIANDTIVVNGINYVITDGSSDVDNIVMVVPEQIENHSREFIVSFKPTGIDIVPSVSVKFDDSIVGSGNSHIIYLWHGDEITDNTIQVLTGEKTTLKFQEISKNVFVVTDCDDSLLAHDINENREKAIALQEKVDELTERLSKLEKLIDVTFAWDENNTKVPAKLILKSQGSIDYYLDIDDDGMLMQQKI